ncbi:glycosyltransferase family 10 domain-containing protein [Dinghuibacter silviterrae]|uniref:Glycosyl transferase family 10 (Putative fucosyltransferase) n=1 Tax=Dinghuibacter silviterrae TaxID=1539049 RepID=A0A4R8DHM2_9BACT|nr:glycosyltransferase family 10 [Dinghuibacter silviterrae]TDW97027.1 glycosyl transferase family 10 (putative fucosyltransferase) [Dinghuibacter silviterrae]
MSIKVKFSCFWQDHLAAYHHMQQYAFGSPVWKDMELVADESYDVLAILTRPHHSLRQYDRSKAVTFLTEPPESKNVIPHETSSIVPMYLPLPFWQNFSAGERQHVQTVNLPKTELLSSVTSDLTFLEGHVARLQLIRLLDQRIEDGFDLWGKAYTDTFFDKITAYKGEITQKYDALWPYQYHLACENSFVDNYFTEKIADPILAECLCFYDGCLNIAQFIDDRAFIKIDVFDPFNAIDTIIRSIEDDEWSKRITYIAAQKKRLLSDLNPLNIVWLALKGKDVIKECSL